MKGTVLVVEDDQLIASLIKDILEDDGYIVLQAVDGGGLEEARVGHPDVILLDMNMPGTAGPEVSHQIRADPTIAKSPIIGMSAVSESEARARGVQADDWLQKPFEITALFEKVARWSRLSASDHRKSGR